MKKKMLLSLWVSFVLISSVFYPKEKSYNSSSYDQLMAYVFNEIDYEYKDIATKDLESSVQIYFLGGCGYFISGGGKNILVDALYKHPHPKFPDVRTPEDAYKKMLKGEPPFQRIDLILVSHYHPDHFTTDRGFPVLMEHPESRMIANQYTLSLAKEDDPENYERVKNQIIQIDLEWGEIKDISLDGCPIKAYLVKHTTGDHLDREYIVTQFLLELEGLKILHMGDMYTPPNMEYFKKFGLEKEHIDLVFHAGGISDTVKILMNEYIKPKFFVVMHNRLYEEGQYYRSFLDIFPNAAIFLKPMERKIFLKDVKK
jgi:L-ascorbate metabolism protein UlaG (beta-lactamase superfamily)